MVRETIHHDQPGSAEVLMHDIDSLRSRLNALGLLDSPEETIIAQARQAIEASGVLRDETDREGAVASTRYQLYLLGLLIDAKEKTEKTGIGFILESVRARVRAYATFLQEAQPDASKRQKRAQELEPEFIEHVLSIGGVIQPHVLVYLLQHGKVSVDDLARAIDIKPSELYQTCYGANKVSLRNTGVSIDWNVNEKTVQLVVDRDKHRAFTASKRKTVDSFATSSCAVLTPAETEALKLTPGKSRYKLLQALNNGHSVTTEELLDAVSQLADEAALRTMVSHTNARLFDKENVGLTIVDRGGIWKMVARDVGTHAAFKASTEQKAASVRQKTAQLSDVTFRYLGVKEGRNVAGLLNLIRTGVPVPTDVIVQALSLKGRDTLDSLIGHANNDVLDKRKTGLQILVMTDQVLLTVRDNQAFSVFEQAADRREREFTDASNQPQNADFVTEVQESANSNVKKLLSMFRASRIILAEEAIDSLRLKDRDHLVQTVFTANYSAILEKYNLEIVWCGDRIALVTKGSFNVRRKSVVKLTAEEKERRIGERVNAFRRRAAASFDLQVLGALQIREGQNPHAVLSALAAGSIVTIAEIVELCDEHVSSPAEAIALLRRINDSILGRQNTGLSVVWNDDQVKLAINSKKSFEAFIAGAGTELRSAAESFEAAPGILITAEQLQFLNLNTGMKTETVLQHFAESGVVDTERIAQSAGITPAKVRHFMRTIQSNVFHRKGTGIAMQDHNGTYKLIISNQEQYEIFVNASSRAAKAARREAREEKRTAREQRLAHETMVSDFTGTPGVSLGDLERMHIRMRASPAHDLLMLLSDGAVKTFDDIITRLPVFKSALHVKKAALTVNASLERNQTGLAISMTDSYVKLTVTNLGLFEQLGQRPVEKPPKTKKTTSDKRAREYAEAPGIALNPAVIAWLGIRDSLRRTVFLMMAGGVSVSFEDIRAQVPEIGDDMEIRRVIYAVSALLGKKKCGLSVLSFGSSAKIIVQDEAEWKAFSDDAEAAKGEFDERETIVLLPEHLKFLRSGSGREWKLLRLLMHDGTTTIETIIESFVELETRADVMILIDSVNRLLQKRRNTGLSICMFGNTIKLTSDNPDARRKFDDAFQADVTHHRDEQAQLEETRREQQRESALFMFERGVSLPEHCIEFLTGSVRGTMRSVLKQLVGGTAMLHDAVQEASDGTLYRLNAALTALKSGLQVVHLGAAMKLTVANQEQHTAFVASSATREEERETERAASIAGEFTLECVDGMSLNEGAARSMLAALCAHETMQRDALAQSCGIEQQKLNSVVGHVNVILRSHRTGCRVRVTEHEVHIAVADRAEYEQFIQSIAEKTDQFRTNVNVPIPSVLIDGITVSDDSLQSLLNMCAAGNGVSIEEIIHKNDEIVDAAGARDLVGKLATELDAQECGLIIRWFGDHCKLIRGDRNQFRMSVVRARKKEAYAGAPAASLSEAERVSLGFRKPERARLLGMLSDGSEQTFDAVRSGIPTIKSDDSLLELIWSVNNSLKLSTSGLALHWHDRHVRLVVTNQDAFMPFKQRVEGERALRESFKDPTGIGMKKIYLRSLEFRETQNHYRIVSLLNKSDMSEDELLAETNESISDRNALMLRVVYLNRHALHQRGLEIIRMNDRYKLRICDAKQYGSFRTEVREALGQFREIPTPDATPWLQAHIGKIKKRRGKDTADSRDLLQLLLSSGECDEDKILKLLPAIQDRAQLSITVGTANTALDKRIHSGIRVMSCAGKLRLGIFDHGRHGSFMEDGKAFFTPGEQLLSGAALDRLNVASGGFREKVLGMLSDGRPAEEKTLLSLDPDAVHGRARLVGIVNELNDGKLAKAGLGIRIVGTLFKLQVTDAKAYAVFRASFESQERTTDSAVAMKHDERAGTDRQGRAVSLDLVQEKFESVAAMLRREGFGHLEQQLRARISSSRALPETEQLVAARALHRIAVAAELFQYYQLHGDELPLHTIRSLLTEFKIDVPEEVTSVSRNESEIAPDSITEDTLQNQLSIIEQVKVPFRTRRLISQTREVIRSLPRYESGETSHIQSVMRSLDEIVTMIDWFRCAEIRSERSDSKEQRENMLRLRDTIEVLLVYAGVLASGDSRKQ